MVRGLLRVDSLLLLFNTVRCVMWQDPSLMHCVAVPSTSGRRLEGVEVKLDTLLTFIIGGGQWLALRKESFLVEISGSYGENEDTFRLERCDRRSLSWWRRLQALLKRRLISTRLHGTASQKKILPAVAWNRNKFIFIAFVGTESFSNMGVG
jgi:hypothetical protein